MSDQRRCAEPDCITILARDNRSRYCSACQRKHPPQRIGTYAGAARGRPSTYSLEPKVETPPEKRYRTCRQCGSVITTKLAESNGGHCRPCAARPMVIDDAAIEAFLRSRGLG